MVRRQNRNHDPDSHELELEEPAGEDRVVLGKLGADKQSGRKAITGRELAELSGAELAEKLGHAPSPDNADDAVIDSQNSPDVLVEDEQHLLVNNGSEAAVDHEEQILNPDSTPPANQGMVPSAPNIPDDGDTTESETVDSSQNLSKTTGAQEGGDNHGDSAPVSEDSEQGPAENTLTAPAGNILGRLGTIRDRTRNLREDTEKRRALKLAEESTLEECIEFLDTEVFPELERLRAADPQDPEEATINATRIEELEEDERAVYALNLRVKSALEAREEDRLAKIAEEKKDSFSHEVSRLWSLATVETQKEGFEKLAQTEEPQILPPLILQAGTLVPLPRDEQDTQGVLKKMPLATPAALLCGIRKQQFPGPTGAVINHRVQYVIETVGAPVHFTDYRTGKDLEPGSFICSPPEFRRAKPEDRETDALDAIKEACAARHKSEADAYARQRDRQMLIRRLEQHFEQLAGKADCPIAEFVLADKSGTAVADTPDYPDEGVVKKFRTVLTRSRDGGPVMILAWGPSPTKNWHPHLNGLRNIRVTITDRNLELARRGDGTPILDKKTGLPTGSGSLDVSVIPADYEQKGQDVKAQMRAQCTALKFHLRQAVLDDLYARELHGEPYRVSQSPAEEETPENVAVPESEELNVTAQVTTDEADTTREVEPGAGSGEEPLAEQAEEASAEAPSPIVDEEAPQAVDETVVPEQAVESEQTIDGTGPSEDNQQPVGEMEGQATATEAPADSAAPIAEAGEASTKPHRHYWRTDDTCRCDAKKPSESEVSG